MKIKVIQADAVQHETPALVVNLFDGVTIPGGATGAADAATGGLISRLIADAEVRGKSGEITVIHTPSSAFPDCAPQRIIVAGLGNSPDFNYESIRRTSAQVARRLRSLRVNKAATIVHGAGAGGLDPARCAEAIAEGALLGLYKFDKYKSGAGVNGDDANGNGDLLEELEIVEIDPARIPALEAGAGRGRVFAEAAIFARDLVNEPPNVLSPEELARAAAEMAGECGLKADILDAGQCRDLGMRAFLAVAQGSARPPKLIHLTYEGDPDNPGNNLWLVGKAITFDSGGLSLKSPAGMITMKGDMGGAAAALGAIKAIAALKPRINVHVLCAAAENMPGGSAKRPGDVVQAMSGKWIEVENTDAEGRLTLADAIAYARSKSAARIVDIATLTGAVNVALGKGHTGAFSNNDELYEAVSRAAATRGEPVWRLPLDPVSKRQNNSRIADLKNTGGRDAGSITAAHFIAEFAGDTPWVHLDIAAMVMSDAMRGVNVQGATGIPARTLVQLALDLAENSKP